jgi:recombination protein RecA
VAKQKFDLDAYKKTIKLADTPLKPDSYVSVNTALQAVLGVAGIPLGHITQIFGRSDTGKTSLLFHIAAQAQAQNILPVLVITEGKVDWDRAKAMGFDRDSAIINEGCEYLEDAFSFVDKITADVTSGELPQDVIILFDSVGNTLSRDEVTVNEDGTTERKASMMKAAKVLSEQMRVISRRINDTRKISSPKNVGLVVLNQSYVQPPQFTGGPSTEVPYGGQAIWYRSSLVLRTKRSKTLTATVKGIDLKFGIISKITVDKNHLTNVSHSGDFLIVEDEILPNEKGAIQEYKNKKREQWGDAILNDEDT